MHRLFRALTPRPERPAWLGVALVLLLLLLGLSAFAVRLRVDNRIEQWLALSPESVAHYQEFRERFGSDEYVMVMYCAAPIAFWSDIAAWFPNAVVLSGYGNSLAGVCPQVDWRPGELPTYFPHGPRLHFRIARPDAAGRGTVVVSRLDESTFLPNIVERDEAGQIPLPAGCEGFAPWGLHDPRPPISNDLPQGLY